MIAVSDTSPILNLSGIDRLLLLRDLYLEIVIPPAVERELYRNGIRLEPSWMRVVAARDQNQVGLLRRQLDPGEAEAIVIAGELHAGLLLVDEKRGRRVALERGLE